MIKDRPCSRCKTATSQEICCRLNADESQAFGWWCDKCHWWNQRANGSGFWIQKDELERSGVEISTIRVVEILTQPRCAKCGKRGAQQHHWAPKHLFKDAEDWPKDYLCTDCHRLWHDVVTPNMGGSYGDF